MNRFNIGDLDFVYFCAGARNHKLKKSFAPEKLRFELDERSASFKALGAAKAGKLAAVCVTSGTAVAQCLPAMIEAYYSNTPFILISGDRPRRLIGTGAPQTIAHLEATRGYAKKQVEVLDAEFDRLSLEEPAFPLHINVLVDKDHSIENRSKSVSAEAAIDFLGRFQRSLFLISHDTVSMRPLAQKLLEKTRYVYCETLSQAKDLSPIANEFELLSMFRAGEFDSVVRVGHTPLNKLWRLIDTADIPVLSLDPRGLAALSHGEVYAGAYSLLDEAPIKRNEYASSFDWSLLGKYPKSQFSWIKNWQDSLPENSLVYLGNSSVIRDFEAVQTKPFRTFGNRGANGIDGQLSTAIGIAESLDEKLYCLLGDLTYLYDYSASFQLPPNLEVVALDNKGGRIFERVGISDEIVLEDKSLLSRLDLPAQVSAAVICPEQTLACFKELSQ